MKTKSSKNYEWFKFFPNNRPISKKHLNNLRKQFQEYGNITEVSPITVNVNGFVFDGQHRRILCEEFGLEVHYNEVDKKKELTPAMNSNQKPWTALNYVDFFAAYKPEYEILSRFISKNDTNFPIASAALFPERGNTQIYKNLKTGDLEVSHVVDEGQKRMNIIGEISDIMGAALTESYARGILRALYVEQFDINRYLAKLKNLVDAGSGLPAPRATTTLAVMKNIEGIYNWHTQEKNSVIIFR